VKKTTVKCMHNCEAMEEALEDLGRWWWGRQ